MELFKNTKKKIILVVTSLALLSGCAPKITPEDPCNFVQNSKSQRVSWNNELPIQIYFDDSIPQVHMSAIVRAMESWNEELGRPILEFAGVVDQGFESIQDKASVVYWRDSWEEARPGEQARTTIFWKGNQVQEADIQVNAQDFTFSTNSLESGKIDMESLMIHEFGHVLGLSHNEDGGSVMASRLASGTARRKISQDDLSSLSCEY